MSDQKILNQPDKNDPRVILLGDRRVTFIPTPTSYYLDMQTKAQGAGGKIMIRRYAEEVLKRVEEDYKIDDFTPNDINYIVESFDTFCNAPRK